MRKYLGSIFTAFGAVIVPLFLCFPLLFGINVLWTEVNGSTVFLFIMCISASITWALYLRNIVSQLYSWGFFKSDYVQITICLSKSSTIFYNKCKSCGIAFYIHRILNHGVGTKIYFIYLSYDVFDEQFRTKINLWKPTKTQIKTQFNKKLYNHLLAVLPQKQAQMLRRDYEKYFPK